VLNSTITYEHEVKSSLSISPCHNHELTQSTTYTKYSIIPRLTVSHSQPVSHLSADVVLDSLHSHNCKLTNEQSLSCCRASLQIERLQVLLQSPSIIACKCISKLARSQPQSAPPHSINHCLQAHHLSSLDLGLQVYLQTRSITASKFARSWPPSVSPNSLDPGLQKHLPSSLDLGLEVYLQTRSMTVCKFARSWPPSASANSVNPGLHVHL